MLGISIRKGQKLILICHVSKVEEDVFGNLRRLPGNVLRETPAFTPLERKYLQGSDSGIFSSNIKIESYNSFKSTVV